MKFAIRDHQRKGARFAKALLDAGHEMVPLGTPADTLLIDLDIDHPAYLPLLELYRDARIVVYPHGAAPIMAYDGAWNAHPATTACLVPAPGHQDIARKVGYPHPTHVVGFPLCDQAPFRTTKGERVLFAPHHPLGDGWIDPAERWLNGQVFEDLLYLDVALTVRHVGDLENNGLWDAPDVRYIPAGLEVDASDIDDHDLVIAAYGTYAFLAVARGCPTVMFGQDSRPYDLREGKKLYMLNWTSYRDDIRYPHDLETLGLVGAMCDARVEASRWRERFIGPCFDPARVVEVCEAEKVTA